MDFIRNQFFIGFSINFILIYIFCKIPLMTRSGWISAGILGTILWGCLSWQGWMSVVIYLIFGSLVTKIGFKFKKEQGIAEKRGGRRGPENVWGSAATGLFLAIMTKLNPANVVMFKIGFAASFAAKLADTFGSEIGKRFGKDTYLITSLKKVDRGTEGGVSLEGTLASFWGSIFMAFVMFRLSIISTKYHFIVVAVSGFLATLSESIIGAKFQNKYKFSEIASSLAYYLKTFSNINKLLDYICLIFKHIFNEKIIFIIPLNYEGEIWFENIKISANDESFKIQEEIKSCFNQFNFSKNFKIKEILIFENALKKIFKEYRIETEKILSRGKCRGFIYIFSKDLSDNSITDDSNFNFIQNCLAVGLENYCLIKTKKKHENVDREISTGAEIQSQLLPDYCPTIHGIDLAAHCRPALQLGGDYYDFMCLKTNISEKRKEKSRWAFVIGDVMGKEIPAGLLMTMLRGMLRAEVLTGLPPDRI